MTQDRIYNLHKTLNSLIFQRKTRTLRDMAIVCCYFNPLHYETKLKNYRKFRKGIDKTNIRFLTVELAFGDDSFQLEQYPDVLRLRTSKNNILWQKERLLNIGIRQLIREGYTKIVWIDADVVFENSNWAYAISQTLDQYPVCQAFKTLKTKNPQRTEPGSIKHYHKTRSLEDITSVPGGVWAARSEVLQQISLYDKGIVGAGDTFFLLGCFFYGNAINTRIKSYHLFQHTPPKLQDDYTLWATHAGSVIRGNVGYARNTIRVLYHGSKENRQRKDRHNILIRHNFDPKKDIALDENLCWSWASDKQKLHKEVYSFFASRKEDD